jgi:hypothetical protein
MVVVVNYVWALIAYILILSIPVIIPDDWITETGYQITAYLTMGLAPILTFLVIIYLFRRRNLYEAYGAMTGLVPMLILMWIFVNLPP